ncbi:MAG TPA: sodium:proton antiporter [Dissulfurispiraceae bacterium]|nr:sodium:proton antiporter [Dissulfurispiraceae bacterium]
MDPVAGMEAAKYILLSGVIIIAAGALSIIVSQRLRVPDVPIFLIAGILLGPGVAGVLNIAAESALNQVILIFGACCILFDGGASVRLKVLKDVWISLTALATIGVLITAGIAALAAWYWLELPPLTALLLGAVIAPTDPATIIPVFRQVRIKEKVSQTLISESAFNDATGSVIMLAILSVAIGSTSFSVTAALADLLKQSVIGIIIGFATGYLGAFLIAHEKYNFLARYAPLVTLMAVIGTYLGAEGLQASGFMAVFVFGTIIGNKRSFGFRMERHEKEKLDDFVARTAMIMRMFIFILLGSQVDFGLLSYSLPGAVFVVVIFMLAARPMTVFLCALLDRRAGWNLRELLFMSWTRETGVIPAALAGLLLGKDIPGAQAIASVTFIAILMTILVQATTAKWTARKLGLLE